MVSERYSNAMAETLHYLKGIRKEDLNKIPNNFMKFLKENASVNYECKFDYNKPLKELNLMDETRGLISMICLNYWCESEEEKNIFKEHLNENEIKHQENLRKKYDIDNIFRQNENVYKNIKESESIDKLQVEEKNFIKKIFNYIINFFHRKVK